MCGDLLVDMILWGPAIDIVARNRNAILQCRWLPRKRNAVPGLRKGQGECGNQHYHEQRGISPMHVFQFMLRRRALAKNANVAIQIRARRQVKIVLTP